IALARVNEDLVAWLNVLPISNQIPPLIFDNPPIEDQGLEVGCICGVLSAAYFEVPARPTRNRVQPWPSHMTMSPLTASSARALRLQQNRNIHRSPNKGKMASISLPKRTSSNGLAGIARRGCFSALRVVQFIRHPRPPRGGTPPAPPPFGSNRCDRSPTS